MMRSVVAGSGEVLVVFKGGIAVRRPPRRRRGTPEVRRSDAECTLDP